MTSILITISRGTGTPIKQQIYDQIRNKIIKGEFVFGHKLPSSRELADELHISRNLVVEVYEQLVSEGYLDSKAGSGTYVAKGAYLERSFDIDDYNFLDEQPVTGTDVIDFRSGIPALDMFPRGTWGLIARRVYRETPAQVFGYGHPEGQYILRHTLSQYLSRTRGVKCHPDQLVITSGATQAFTLAAKLVNSRDSEVLIEDPVTHEIQTIFSSAGFRLHPIPVDDYGMQSDLVSAQNPAFIFVTPSHQFPLGGVLTIQRRIQLINFARQTGCYIIEDDYDSEFRYQGTPVSCLQGLDPERVIYIGTFSKILSPALRLGYLVLPPDLTKRCRNLKWFSDLHTSTFEQLVLAQFMKEGHLEQHISKMKKIYRRRREKLVECLNNRFCDRALIHGDSTGLHLVVEFRGVTFSDEVMHKIHAQGVNVYPVELHTIRKSVHSNKVILGYGNLSLEKIEEGIARLERALE